jgi:signal transduction histidine kinase
MLGTLFEFSLNQNPHGRGTGVELALCQDIIRQHHGQITAESAANDVTILRVTLPAGGQN